MILPPASDHHHHGEDNQIAEINLDVTESEMNPTHHHPERADAKETARLEAFSDGVFAIAITLLILELHVPKPSELHGQSLWAALLDDWPSYVAFLLSFGMILIMWFNHHKLFTHISRVDHLFPYLNGFLLLMVTIVPWPTSLLAEYVGEAEEKTAAAVYSGTSMILAIAFNILWRYATHKGRLLAANADMEEVHRITKHYSFGPLLYLLAFVLSFVSVYASIGLCMALAVFFSLTGAISEERIQISNRSSLNEPD